jgi:hypothetical protein
MDPSVRKSLCAWLALSGNEDWANLEDESIETLVNQLDPSHSQILMAYKKILHPIDTPEKLLAYAMLMVQHTMTESPIATIQNSLDECTRSMQLTSQILQQCILNQNQMMAQLQKINKVVHHQGLLVQANQDVVLEHLEPRVAQVEETLDMQEKRRWIPWLQGKAYAVVDKILTGSLLGVQYIHNHYTNSVFPNVHSMASTAILSLGLF